MIGFIRNLLSYANETKFKRENQFNAGPAPEFVGLKKLTAPHYLTYVAPIQYIHDPVPRMPSYLNQLQKKFPKRAPKRNDSIDLNSIELDPFAAELPYRSSLSHVRANKYWKLNLSQTLKLLKLFAEDRCAADVEVKNGITLSKIAEKELRPGIEHRIVPATVHMFPGASQERTQHISALMLIYFICDDKVEETLDNSLYVFREDFLRRLNGPNSSDSTSSELQRHIDSIVEGTQEEDAIAGNGGKEMFNALRGAFLCVHVNKNFQTVNDYLEFRRLNVGAAFVIAAAKYSIKSSVDSSDPRFKRYLSLIGDHLGLVNDLASYDKELRAFEKGEATEMINLVAVMTDLLSLPNSDAAKAATYVYQLQVESWIIEEIEQLAANEKLTDEEWRFIEAVLLAATGNVFWSMISSRYGGEAAKIKQIVEIEETSR